MSGTESPTELPALRDELTGLPNRLHFELIYNYMFEGADRGVPMALMLTSVGDVPRGEAMRALGARFQQITRSADLSAHLGQGRFVTLMLGTNLMGARVGADRFLDTLSADVEGHLSIGVAGYQPHMKEPSQLIGAAEAALRAAEAAGGGVELAPL
jgi:GGDEF domain-containing protein